MIENVQVSGIVNVIPKFRGMLVQANLGVASLETFSGGCQLKKTYCLMHTWSPRSKVLSGKTAFFLKRKAGKKIFKGAPLGEQLTERRRGAEYLKTSVALRTNFQLSSSAQIGDHQSFFMDQD